MKSLVDKVKNGVRAAGKVGVCTAVGAGCVIAGLVNKTEAMPTDFTSWSQVYNAGGTEQISNNGDFYVDGVLASGVKCGAGLLKDGNIIGHWDNGSEWNMGEWFVGSVNVEPSGNPNSYALLPGKRNDGMFGTYDFNGDGNWGTYDSDTGILNGDIGELILNPQGIIVDGVRGDFSSLPRYWGSIDGMEDYGKFPRVEFDSSYAEGATIPEPASIILTGIGLGLVGAARRRGRKRKYVESKVVDKK